MPAPIGHTCPQIDKILREINHYSKEITRFRNYNDPEEIVDDFLGEIGNLLSDVIDNFERLRKSNDCLRSWGVEMEDQYKILESQYNTLESENLLLKNE